MFSFFPETYILATTSVQFYFMLQEEEIMGGDRQWCWTFVVLIGIVTDVELLALVGKKVGQNCQVKGAVKF